MAPARKRTIRKKQFSLAIDAPMMCLGVSGKDSDEPGKHVILLMRKSDGMLVDDPCWEYVSHDEVDGRFRIHFRYDGSKGPRVEYVMASDTLLENFSTDLP